MRKLGIAGVESHVDLTMKRWTDKIDDKEEQGDIRLLVYDSLNGKFSTPKLCETKLCETARLTYSSNKIVNNLLCAMNLAKIS